VRSLSLRPVLAHSEAAQDEVRTLFAAWYERDKRFERQSVRKSPQLALLGNGKRLYVAVRPGCIWATLSSMLQGDETKQNVRDRRLLDTLDERYGPRNRERLCSSAIRLARPTRMWRVEYVIRHRNMISSLAKTIISSYANYSLA
jgi:hypothetical protein